MLYNIQLLVCFVAVVDFAGRAVAVATAFTGVSFLDIVFLSMSDNFSRFFTLANGALLQHVYFAVCPSLQFAQWTVASAPVFLLFLGHILDSCPSSQMAHFSSWNLGSQWDLLWPQIKHWKCLAAFRSTSTCTNRLVHLVTSLKAFGSAFSIWTL